jgi:hypothetical protein
MIFEVRRVARQLRDLGSPQNVQSKHFQLNTAFHFACMADEKTVTVSVRLKESVWGQACRYGEGLLPSEIKREWPTADDVTDPGGSSAYPSREDVAERARKDGF